MAIDRFAGIFNALSNAYGVNPAVPPLMVATGCPAGAGTIVLDNALLANSGAWSLAPLNVNAPITIGSGASAETVTPSAVSAGTPAVYQSPTVTATFANAHGNGDLVSSGTIGLQETINMAYAYGGGIVVVDAAWAQAGGTTAMIAAASLPGNGTVIIEDHRGGPVQFYAARATGAAIAAPVQATSTTVTNGTAAGAWTAVTTHVRFTYVTATGGETLASADYTFTPTGALSIVGPGPAAATGAVGYRVYISTSASGYLLPVNATNGTPIQCGPIAAFKIGTPFFSAVILTNTSAAVPGASTAFGTVANAASATGAVATFPVGVDATSGAILSSAPLPAGFLNTAGRTIRIKGTTSSATNSTPGTLTLALKLYSLYGVTSITAFTAVSGATTGSAVVNCNFEILMTTVGTGASGTVECHGTCIWNLAGSAVGTASMDLIAAVSGAIDLTKANTLDITVTAATTATTANILRQCTVEVLA